MGERVGEGALLKSNGDSAANVCGAPWVSLASVQRQCPCFGALLCLQVLVSSDAARSFSFLSQQKEDAEPALQEVKTFFGMHKSASLTRCGRLVCRVVGQCDVIRNAMVVSRGLPMFCGPPWRVCNEGASTLASECRFRKV